MAVPRAGPVRRSRSYGHVRAGTTPCACGVSFGQLAGPCCRPEVLPQHFRPPMFGWVQAVSTTSCGRRHARSYVLGPSTVPISGKAYGHARRLSSPGTNMVFVVP
jgi:hypothetical protein